MLLSINKRDSAKGASVHGTHTHHKQHVLSFNRYVTGDLHVLQGQTLPSKQFVILLLTFSDTFVSHIRVSGLCLVLFVN